MQYQRLEMSIYFILFDFKRSLEKFSTQKLIYNFHTVCDSVWFWLNISSELFSCGFKLDLLVRKPDFIHHLKGWKVLLKLCIRHHSMTCWPCSCPCARRTSLFTSFARLKIARSWLKHSSMLSYPCVTCKLFLTSWTFFFDIQFYFNWKSNLWVCFNLNCDLTFFTCAK